MRRRLVGALAAAGVLLSGSGLATAATDPELGAEGPGRLDGTTADAVFELGSRTIRQFRYADREELGYTFELTNGGALPVTVVDAVEAGAQATLLRVDRLERAGSPTTRFTIPAGDEVGVRLVLDMGSCERVSSRAGSLIGQVSVVTELGGVLERRSVVQLPEELHTGSPREARCPRATSSSRSAG